VEMAQQQLEYVDNTHAYIDWQVKNCKSRITYPVITLWTRD
jgi:hypothetical protein